MFKRFFPSVMAFCLLLGTVLSSPVQAQNIVAAVSRIRFAAGATSAAVDGTLGRGRTQDYLIRALGGQTLMLTLTANNDSAQVWVYRRFFRRLLPGRRNATGFTGYIPVTGDYVIRVTGNSSTQYSMNVTIPQRITFKRGAISGTVTGHTDENRTVTYLLRARKNQTMKVNLQATSVVSPTDQAMGLTIYGLTDGQPLVRAVSDATRWTGKLPMTQDYVVEAVPAMSGVISFTLGVTVTNR